MNGQIEPSAEILFFFSQINALDNVPVRFIKKVQIVEDKLVYDIVDDSGEKKEEKRLKTVFQMNQAVGYELL